MGDLRPEIHQRRPQQEKQDAVSASTLIFPECYWF